MTLEHDDQRWMRRASHPVGVGRGTVTIASGQAAGSVATGKNANLVHVWLDVPDLSGSTLTLSVQGEDGSERWSYSQSLAENTEHAIPVPFGACPVLPEDELVLTAGSAVGSDTEIPVEVRYQT